MREHLLHREQVLDVGVEDAFAFFSRAENLEAITPPWLRFRIVDPAPSEVEEGTMIAYRLRLRGIPIRWLTQIEEWDPPRRFVDRQVEGPYALWHHTHSFEPISENRTRMADVVRYRHRLGPLGSLAQRLIVERDLRRIFDYRRDAIAAGIQQSRKGAPQ